MQSLTEEHIKKLIKALSRWSITFILTGLVILIIALIIGFSESYLGQEIYFGTNLLFLGIGVFSLGIAFLSIKMADESDKKMTAIANSHFIEIYEEIQNITLKEILPNITEDSQEANNLRGAYVWKYNHSLERAILLKEWADESQRTNLVLPFGTLLKRIPWDKQMIENKDIKDLLDGYLLIRELDIPNNLVEEIEGLLKSTIVKQKKDENLVGCIKRTQNKLEKNPTERFKSPHY